jgi:ATP-dependent exoDNAse (exonuclease V) alpha subunit
LRDGGHLAQIEWLTDAVLTNEGVAHLGVEGPGGEERLTVASLLELERHLLDVARDGRRFRAGLADRAAIEAALRARPSLSAEQEVLVRCITSSGNLVEVVIGKAGAGKTFALDGARAAWNGSGLSVQGAALSARAAAELESGTGIPSVTLARLLAGIEKSEVSLGARSVVVLDEAGMVGTRQLARLADATSEAGAKLLLIGDPYQLPEIEAGGALVGLVAAVGAAKLTENRRQREPWERNALDELRSGRVIAAVDAYTYAGRVHLAHAAEAARACLVSDWADSFVAGEHAEMYAPRRHDVEALNVSAREELRHRGLLGDDVIEAGERRFALGDEVMCLRNDRRPRCAQRDEGDRSPGRRGLGRRMYRHRRESP